VEGCAESQLSTTELKEGCPELASELWVSIRDDGVGQSMIAKHCIKEKRCKGGSRHCFDSWGNAHTPGSFVDKSNRGIETTRCGGQAGDEVHCDCAPPAVWYFQRH